MSNGDNTGGMGAIASMTAQEVDDILQDQEAELLKSTTYNIEELRPQFALEEAEFNKLIQAIETATSQNESIALFKQRLADLGEGVVKLAARVAEHIPT